MVEKSTETPPDAKDGVESGDTNQSVGEISEPKVRLEVVDPMTLKISKYNIRKKDPRGSTWDEFCLDVKENNVLFPPIVTPSNEVVAGQRRVLAAQAKKLEEIVILRLFKEPTEVEAIAMSIRENHHREPVNQDDRLDAILQVRDGLDNDLDAIARIVGCGKYTVQAWLSMESIRRKVPEIKQLGIEKGRIVKRILATPEFENAPIEEKRKLVEKAKITSQSALRELARTPVDREMFTINLTVSLKSFLLKKSKERMLGLSELIEEILRPWAEENGWKG